MSKRLELFDKLIAGGSRDPFHHYARAMELRSLKRDPEALEGFATLTAQFPDYVPSYLMAAQLAQALGELTRAREFAASGIASAQRGGDEHAESELRALLATLPAS